MRSFISNREIFSKILNTVDSEVKATSLWEHYVSALHHILCQYAHNHNLPGDVEKGQKGTLILAFPPLKLFICISSEGKTWTLI